MIFKVYTPADSLSLQVVIWCPYCGHSVLMGKVNCDWQNTDKILEFFGNKYDVARRTYRRFVNKGIGQGKRTDLTGGGLIRSAGGWAAVKALRAAKVFEKADERILGNGDFVESVLKAANEQMKKRYDLKSRGFELNDVVARVVHVMEIEEERIWAAGRHREIVQARSLLCYWAVRELGVTMVSLARRLDQSVTAVGKAVIRGEKLAKMNNFSLLEK